MNDNKHSVVGLFSVSGGQSKLYDSSEYTSN